MHNDVQGFEMLLTSCSHQIEQCYRKVNVYNEKNFEQV